MTTDKPTPSAAQWIALLDFRDRHGRNWRDHLSTAWMNGQDENEPHAPHLRALRNHFGTAWLYRLKSDELQRQRERFTLKLAFRSVAEVKAENEAAAVALANLDGLDWAALPPEQQLQYLHRVGVVLLTVLKVREEQERGR